MSDVTVKISLQEDISQKMQKAASVTRTASSQIQQAGKAIDNAFKTSSPEQLAAKVGKAISSVSEQAAQLGDTLDGLIGSDEAVSVGLKVDDNATSAIGDVEDRAAALNGTSASVGLAADDAATPVINDAGDAASAFDGIDASAEIGAEDNASGIVDAAADKVSAFDGMDGSAEVGAEDNASSVIDSVTDKAEAWDGSVWEATLSIVDGVTAPLSAIGKAVKNPLAQAATMLGVGVGVNEIKDTYADFEATMSQVKALADATDAEMEALTAKAKEMGAVTKYSGTESAEAFTYMAQAGWTSQQMIDGIGGIMSLAASDGISLANASDIVSSALSAFGMQAKDSAEFADVLAVAASATQTDVTNLGEALKYIAPVAGAMNYDLQDVSLALGMMSNQAINGSQAGTTLRSALTNLAKPTDDMAAAMDKYGISLTDGEDNMKSLRTVMDNLRAGLGGLSEAEQMQAAATLFGKEAMTGMLAIINTSEDDYQNLASQIDNATGAADRMAETMQDNLAGTLEQMGGAIETVELSWGERMAPYIKDVANVIADSMPAIEEAGLAVFDYMDDRVASLKRNITAMVGSAEWKDADLFGKINIAWDTLIADPFLDWAGSEGASLISDGISMLFSEAGKILPGGEEAGIMSWLSAGLLAKGGASLINTAGNVVKALTPIAGAIKDIGSAAKTATGIGGFVSEIGNMIPMAGKASLAAAGITAAIAAIVLAVEDYNNTQIQHSLDEHFGDISLDADQVEAFASKVLNAEWLVNINTALGHIENAEELEAQAEEALKANDTLEWQARVGMTLTEEDQAAYQQNIETFAANVESALSERTISANLIASEFNLTAEDGSSLADKIEEWAEIDMAQMDLDTQALTQLVEDALTDGIIDVDEQAAIDQMQQKINNILNAWKEAEAQAELDMLTQKYGRLSGADLEDESFLSVVDELAAQRVTAQEALDEATKSAYSTINALNRPDENGVQRIGGGRDANGNAYGELAYYQQQIAQASQNQSAALLANSLQFESNTLSDAYGEKLNENYAAIQEQTSNFMDNAAGYLRTNDYSALSDALTYGFNSSMVATNFFSSEDQKALSEIYKAMEPDVSAMAETIDKYRELGQAIPEDVMSAFNEAVQIGAAAGNADAAWQVFANQLVADPANETLLKAINDGMVAVPDELRTAIERATAETTDEPITIEGLQAELEDVEVNTDRVDELIAQAYEGLEATGNTITLEGGEVLVEYEVKTGDTLSGIAEKTGVALEKLKAANQHIFDERGSWDWIYEGDLIYIPNVEADTSAAAEAAGQAAEEAQQAAQGAADATDQTVTAEGTVNTEYTAGEATGAEEAAQEVAEKADEAAKSASTEPKTVPASIVIELQSIDDAALSEGISGALAAREEAIPVDVPAAVTVQIGSVDSSALSTDITSYLTGGEEGGASVPVDVPAAINVTAGEINTSETTEAAASQAQSDLEAAFASTFETAGSVNVTLTETNNVPAIYSEVGGAIASAFAQGYSASASVGVTLYANYSLANPTATISFGGGASGSATVSASLHAKGGYFDEPHLGMVAEAGVGEYIIPIDGSERSKAMWADAGQMLGIENYGAAAIEDGVPYVGLVDSPDFTPITKHAAGGYFDEPHLGMVAEGGVGEYILPMDGSDRSVGMWQDAGRMLGIGTPQRSTIAPMDSTPDAGEPTQPQGGSSERTVNVNINGSGTISVSGEGMTKEQVVDLMLERAKEVFMSIVEQEIVEEGDGTYEW